MKNNQSQLEIHLKKREKEDIERKFQDQEKRRGIALFLTKDT
jgi:hypothetical protein